MLPRKQRKNLYTAPLHKKRKWIAAHLSEDLLTRYNRRSVPVVKGDTVKIMRGNSKGHTDKVVNIDVKRQKISVEGVTISKEDGTKVIRKIHPSNVLITKLNLTDRWRLTKLQEGLSEEIKKEIEQEAEEQIKEIEEKEPEEKIKEKEEAEKEEPEEKEEAEKEEPEEKEEAEKEEPEEKAEKQKKIPKTKEKIDFTNIPGIGEKTAEKLKKAGLSQADLSSMTVNELAQIKGIGDKTAKKLYKELKRREK